MFEAVWQMAAPAADAGVEGSDLQSEPMCSIMMLVATAMEDSALTAARATQAFITASVVSGDATERSNMHCGQQ